MEYDPLGLNELVVVIMKGKVYKKDGLRNSSHPDIEGRLYDKLCSLNRNKLRNEVREMASEIAISLKNEEFDSSIKWLDDFMKRFCLTRKKAANASAATPKVKGSKNKDAAMVNQNGKDSPPKEEKTKDDVTPEKNIVNGSKDSEDKLPSSSPETQNDIRHDDSDVVCVTSPSDPLTIELNSSSSDVDVNTSLENNANSNEDSLKMNDQTGTGSDTKLQMSDDEADGNTSINEHDKQSSHKGKRSDESGTVRLEQSDEVIEMKEAHKKRSKATIYDSDDEKDNSKGKKAKEKSNSSSDTDENSEIKKMKSAFDVLCDSEGKDAEENSKGRKTAKAQDHGSDIEDKEEYKEKNKSSKKESKSSNHYSDIEEDEEDSKGNKKTKAINLDDSDDEGKHESKGNRKSREGNETDSEEKGHKESKKNKKLNKARHSGDNEEDQYTKGKKTSERGKRAKISAKSSNLDSDSEEEKGDDTDSEEKEHKEKKNPKGVTKARHSGANEKDEYPKGKKTNEGGKRAKKSAKSSNFDSDSEEEKESDDTDSEEKVLKEKKKLKRLNTRHRGDNEEDKYLKGKKTNEGGKIAKKSANSSNLDSDSEEEKENVKKTKKASKTSSHDSNTDDEDNSKGKKKIKKAIKPTSHDSDSEEAEEDSTRKKKTKKKDKSTSNDSDNEKNKSKKGVKNTRHDSSSEMEVEHFKEGKKAKKGRTYNSESSEEEKKSTKPQDGEHENSEDEPSIIEVSDGSSHSEAKESEAESLLKEEKIIYSTKEDDYYQKNQQRLQLDIETKLNRCTACQDQVNYLEMAMVFTHPILGVLVCKKCRKFYGKGNFQKDSEGLDNYCRWCANGGDMLICDCCTNGFCKKCVKRNLGRSAETEALNAKVWKCYVCRKKPLLELRCIQRVILEGLSKKKNKISRKDQKLSSLKQKNSVLKAKQKDKKVETARKSKWIDECIMDMEELLEDCIKQFVKIKEKREAQPNAHVINSQSVRRLIKLCTAMKGNFSTLKETIEEKAEKFPLESLPCSEEQSNKKDCRKNSESIEGEETKKSEGKSLKKKKTASHSESDVEDRKAEKKIKEKPGPLSKKKSLAKDKLMEESIDAVSNDDEQEDKGEATRPKRDRESSSGDDDKERGSKKKKKESSQDEMEHTSNPPSDEEDKEPSKEATSGDNSDGETQEEPKSKAEEPEKLFSGFSSDEDTETSQKVEEIIDKVSSSDNETKVEFGSSSDDIFKGNKQICSLTKDTSKEESSQKGKDMMDKSKSAFDTLLAEDSSEEASKRKSSDESSSSSKKKKRIIEFSDEGSDKKVDKNENALKSLLNSDSEVSDIDLDKLKIKKKVKRRKPCPRSKSEYYSEEEEFSKCKVHIERLPPRIKKILKNKGVVNLADHPFLLKKRPFQKKKTRRSMDSDEEFSSILKFKVKKDGCEKATDSGENDSDDSESASEKSNEEKAKKKKTVNKEDKEKKQKEGLMDISLDKEEEGDDGQEEKDESVDPLQETQTEEEHLNNKMKKALLMSSDEDGEDADAEDEEDDDEDDDDQKKSKEKDEKTAEEIENKRREKYEKQKKLEEEKKKQEEEEEENKKSNVDESSDDSEIEIKSNKGRKGYISLKFSSSSEDDSEDESPRKTRMFVDSDSDFESEKDKKKGKKKSLLDSTDDESEIPSEESSEDEEEKPRPKRTRIKRTSTSSEEEDNENKDEENQSPSKKRRRHIIRDEDLTESTKNATQQEEDRRKRVVNRQKTYNNIFEIDVESDQKELDKLVLDFNPETKKELIYVNKKLLEHLKPHQVKGIRFMYNTTIESLDCIEDGNKGTGCILAHCMGLGKTLQVIAFVHSLLTNDLMDLHMRRVLVCCPVNTAYNWVAEFKGWLKGKLFAFDVIELISAKDLWHRAYRLDDWFKEGGVCIIGYSMFRNLSNETTKRYKGKMKEIFQRALVDPGPDLIVCDEGHVLKNEKTALSIAINRVRTARRIVLTGTPLQNNLKEYHCMIQFVKPNLLGTKKEFFNRFVNPIEAGQCVDALPREVKRMKRRAHILHNLLEGCVQRFDYTVLKPFLPPKFEYVISIQLSEIQCKLYRYYLENLAQGGPKRSGSGLFVDCTHLQQIWNHPRMLLLGLQRKMYKDEMEEEDDGDDDMSDFICDESDDMTDSSEDDKKKKKKKPKNDDKGSESDKEESEKSQAEEDVNLPGLTNAGKVKSDWFRPILREEGSKEEDGEEKDFNEEEFLNRLEIGGKITLLLDILRECQSIGDKLIVFSQSLLTLNVIEDFLAMLDRREIELSTKENEIPLHFKHWKSDRDYMRLDGSVSADIRKIQCKRFNDKNDERCRLFLISTRAGGIGINLVGANRVIIFDASWNPSHDTQSIFRIYRFGQAKPCYVYRFVAQGTMEEKIYSRQVTKISTSLRVVDEHQIKRYFNMGQLAELYEFNPADPEKRETPNVPEDRLLAEMLIKNKKWIVGFHEHESLLENQMEEELNEEERDAAWEDYENEKKGLVPQMGRQFNMGAFPDQSFVGNLPTYDAQAILDQIRSQNPAATAQILRQSVLMATRQIQKAHLSQYQKFQASLYSLKNPMLAPEIIRNMPFTNVIEAVAHHERNLQAYEHCIQAENAIISQISQYAAVNVPNASMISAGLMRGGAPIAQTSETAEYVNRNYAMINPGASSSSTSTNSNSPSSNFKIKLPLKKPHTPDKATKDQDDSSEVVTLE